MRLSQHPAPVLPIDNWSLREDAYVPAQLALNETLFAQANGTIGTRGTFEEGGARCEGTYLNGVYVKEPIFYEENAYGFATHNDKMIQVPDGKAIRIFADGEAFALNEKTLDYARQLDFRTGVLERSAAWKTGSGKRISVEWKRLVSLVDPHLMAITCHVTSEDFDGEIAFESFLDAAYGEEKEKDAFDPRAGHLSIRNSLSKLEDGADEETLWMLHKTRGDLFVIASACAHQPSEELRHQKVMKEEGRLSQRFTGTLKPGHTISLTKFVSYHHAAPGNEKQVKSACMDTLKHALENGFGHYAEHQAEACQHFWESADVMIDGDPAIQQGMRFNLFHLFQSVGRDGHCNIGAKGLTGPGYDGHYFWDTEMYILPLFAQSQPAIARSLLTFRYNLLDASRRRARQMGHDSGALYAWRTISGDECSAYFPAGSAQYHINADIAYAVRTYLDVTQDWEFIWEMGAEMLCETARIWMGLGHFSERRGGQFCIHGVTGPDEYTAIVDNNFYTNAMARMHLRFAAHAAGQMKAEKPAEFAALANRIHLSEEEISRWQRAADMMLLPVDEALGIHPQDDSFLDKPRWDFEGTPEDKYPLLLHFHPLVIYRHQVLKQADVVLAMVQLGDEFSDDLKRRNLEFYEPLTTHDSTLSTCIYSIACAEAGKYDEAYRFFEESARMDIDNYHRNTHYGIHTACMAGSWRCVTAGFGGMRIADGNLSFAPYLPAKWNSYRFHTRFQGRLISIQVTGREATYALLSGAPLEIAHHGQKLTVQKDKPVTAALVAKGQAA